jgi:ribosomal protein S17
MPKIITYEEVEKQGYNKALRKIEKKVKEIEIHNLEIESNEYDCGLDDCRELVFDIIDKLKK